MKEIKFYKLPNGKEPVKDWLLDLDKSLRVKLSEGLNEFMITILVIINNLIQTYMNYDLHLAKDTEFIIQFKMI